MRRTRERRRVGIAAVVSVEVHRRTFLATRTVRSVIEAPIASQVLTGSDAACRSTFVNRSAALLVRRNRKKYPKQTAPM